MIESCDEHMPSQLTLQYVGSKCYDITPFPPSYAISLQQRFSSYLRLSKEGNNLTDRRKFKIYISSK